MWEGMIFLCIGVIMGCFDVLINSFVIEINVPYSWVVLCFVNVFYIYWAYMVFKRKFCGILLSIISCVISFIVGINVINSVILFLLLIGFFFDFLIIIASFFEIFHVYFLFFIPFPVFLLFGSLKGFGSWHLMKFTLIDGGFAGLFCISIGLMVEDLVKLKGGVR